MEENVEEIIHELIAIENQCAAVGERVNDETAAITARIEEEKRKIDEATDTRIAEEINIINAAAVEETRGRMIETSAQSQKMFAAMEEDYEKHGQEWADEIFGMITRDDTYEI